MKKHAYLLLSISIGYASAYASEGNLVEEVLKEQKVSCLKKPFPPFVPLKRNLTLEELKIARAKLDSYDFSAKAFQELNPIAAKAQPPEPARGIDYWREELKKNPVVIEVKPFKVYHPTLQEMEKQVEEIIREKNKPESLYAEGKEFEELAASTQGGQSDKDRLLYFAIDCYRDAAKQNYPPAQYRLGQMYEEGINIVDEEGVRVEKPLEEALKFYQAAAQHGYKGAQEKLEQLEKQRPKRKEEQEESDRDFKILRSTTSYIKKGNARIIFTKVNDISYTHSAAANNIRRGWGQFVFQNGTECQAALLKT